VAQTEPHWLSRPPLSYENLNSYPEDGPPVVVDYHKSSGERDPETVAQNDNDLEDGTSTGTCPFVVHSLTGEQLVTKSLKALIAIAMDHMDKNRKVLAIGHDQEPQSIYHNPSLYPNMFPWLFPYGLGGIGSKTHKTTWHSSGVPGILSTRSVFISYLLLLSVSTTTIALPHPHPTPPPPPWTCTHERHVQIEA
jgi:hypothetical protein